MSRTTHRSASLLLTLTALGGSGGALGCASAPSDSRVGRVQGGALTPTSSASTRVAHGSDAAPPADPARASVVLRKTPTALALDGDLSEWGSLEPPAPVKKPAEAEAPARTEPVYPPIRPALSDAENPPDASSRIALAVSQAGLSIAAQLGEGRGGEVWIGVSDRPPEPLPLGLYQRGGYTRPMQCERVDHGMFEGEVRYGDPNPPEVVAACEAQKTRYANFTTQYEARFSKRFKLTPTGAFQLAEDDTLTPIIGAHVIAKQGLSTASFWVRRSEERRSTSSRSFPHRTPHGLVRCKRTSRSFASRRTAHSCRLLRRSRCRPT